VAQHIARAKAYVACSDDSLNRRWGNSRNFDTKKNQKIYQVLGLMVFRKEEGFELTVCWSAESAGWLWI